MISVGSRDGRKRIGLGLEMEETELEEGEALSCHDEDEDSTIDPDIALSYIVRIWRIILFASSFVSVNRFQFVMCIEFIRLCG